jgi:NAD(P)-dependent dehydrogenase (short-subunit alcohol dehydrogenase family)
VKIGIFTETYYPVVGGGETQARLLAEGLITNGHSVIVLTRRSDPALRKHEAYGDAAQHRSALREQDPEQGEVEDPEVDLAVPQRAEKRVVE